MIVVWLFCMSFINPDGLNHSETVCVYKNHDYTFNETEKCYQMEITNADDELVTVNIPLENTHIISKLSDVESTLVITTDTSYWFNKVKKTYDFYIYTMVR